VNGADAGFTYDAAGNVTYDNVYRYLYDAEGRICAVENTAAPSPVMTGYLYDAEGNRIAKGTIQNMTSCDPAVNGFVASSEVDSIRDQNGQQMTEAAINSGSGTLVSSHANVWAAGQLLATYAMNQTGTPLSFYFNDPLGTRRVETDYQGTILQSCSSLPFGDGETCQPVPTEHLFTQKERDTETGNDYFGARYYASAMGSFLMPDPYEIVTQKNKGTSAQQQKQLLESFIANPQSWNKYAYALNNPLHNIDIGGNCSVPANLSSGQIGICIEAFIAAPRIAVIGLGDNRTFSPYGGTYRFRVDVRVDPENNGSISINQDVGTSKLGFQSLNIWSHGKGDAQLGPVTSDVDGNRHFEVTGVAANGFSDFTDQTGIGISGTIRFDLSFTASPDGTISLDKAMATTFPSLEIYTYDSGGQTTGTLLNFSEQEPKDLQDPEKCIGGQQCPQ
jgi:RHS repeat-associated protein